MAMFADLCNSVASHSSLPWPLLPVLSALLIRAMIASHGYSGMATPPMFGDYEAQRHWMEITLHTPASEWYRATSANNLSYWGLDYPPLTAYQSWLHGAVLHRIVPEAVALNSSRGFESKQSKLALRWTVISSDLLVFFPAAIAFVSICYHGYTRGQKMWALSMLLLQPGLLLIDHGHFQFNGISLGLCMAAVSAILAGRDILGSFLYCMAINHKHMSLYFAPAFFSFLLGRCLHSPSPLSHFFSLALTVLLSFALCWLPFLTSTDDAQQVLSRLVPLSRGLFEDHVANFWCATSALVKWKRLLSVPSSARLALASTVAAALPSSLCQVLNPTKPSFLLGLLNSSLAFFMFAFQVHEKSILLPSLPISLLCLYYPRLFRLFLPIATLSMLPLLARDKLQVAYFGVQLLFLLLSSPPPPTSQVHAGPLSSSEAQAPVFAARIAEAVDKVWVAHGNAIGASLISAALVLHVAMWTIPPPPQLPFLHPALIVTFSFCLFFAIGAYTNLLQWCLPAFDQTHEKVE